MKSSFLVASISQSNSGLEVLVICKNHRESDIQRNILGRSERGGHLELYGIFYGE